LENDPAHPQIVWGFRPSLPSRPRVLFELMHGGSMQWTRCFDPECV
jgi:hypothetical protein